uniref:Putative secreted protein n=1 Tax=Anopheles darlingi TaxID=43151 RepID=A0A2M4DCK0_ANODA
MGLCFWLAGFVSFSRGNKRERKKASQTIKSRFGGFMFFGEAPNHGLLRANISQTNYPESIMQSTAKEEYTLSSAKVSPCRSPLNHTKSCF